VAPVPLLRLLIPVQIISSLGIFFYPEGGGGTELRALFAITAKRSSNDTHI
jgi:hypothetical protein